jgi:putative ABC transport system permease protein
MTILSKVWHDIWGDKARTLQIVAVIALGAIGVGMVIGGRNLIQDAIADPYQASNPPTIQVSVSPPLTDEQIKRLERIDGIYQAEGVMSQGIEWRRDASEPWQPAVIKSRADLEDQKMDIERLIEGDWPRRNKLAIGSGYDEKAEIYSGDSIQIRLGDSVRDYEILGTIKPLSPAPIFGESITLYADRETFFRITGRRDFNLIQTQDVSYDQVRAEAADLSMREYFDDIGVDSVGISFPFQSRIIPPDIPPAAAILDATFLILGIIGIVVIILGIFLVNNSISAIVTQQVGQIGVMKAIGASSWQVIWGYILLVLIYGLLAVLLSIPIGGAAAWLLQGLFVEFLYLEAPRFSIDSTAILVQVAIGMLAPVAAALFPLKSGLQITVREAINTYGLSGAIGAIGRLVTRLKMLPYSLIMVISNTFRNYRRVIFIELTLVIAGAIFMMVLGVNDATNYTFGPKLESIHHYEVTLSFEDAQRETRIESLVRPFSQVSAVESWLVVPGKARPAEQAEDDVTDARIRIFGIPADTTLYNAGLNEGRWLEETDNRTAVVSTRLINEKGWSLGDSITLTDAAGREENWLIVGTLFDPATDTAIFVPRLALQRQLGQVGQANTVWMQSATPDLQSAEALAEGITEAYESRGIEVQISSTFGKNTIYGIVEDTGGGFGIILTLLAAMAFIIALVGGVGLSGVLSLSVLERRQEIGVMRSIGASTWRVIRLFIGEGVLLGVLSWLIALPLSIPAAYFLSTKGLSLALNTQLIYRFSPVGPLVWLGLIILLAVVASALPARGAARISVRESLSYQ